MAARPRLVPVIHKAVVAGGEVTKSIRLYIQSASTSGRCRIRARGMNFSSFETVIATFRRCINVSQLALGRIAAVESDSFVERLFGQTTRVEWDAAKAASNRDKHGIDFDEAIEIFYGPSLLRRSDRNAEARWLAIGEKEGRVITV